MRNTKKALRKAVFDKLNGQLFFVEGEVEIQIPVYDEKRWATGAEKIFVLLSTQQETPSEFTTDCGFASRSSLDIEIIVKSSFEVTKDTQDDIEQMILDILFPGVYADVLQTDIPGLLIQNLERESSITRNLSLSNSESIMQTVIRVSATITEQS